MASSISEHPSGENVGFPQPGGRPADLLVMDFDGVICDSAPECYVSSLRAHRGGDLTLHPDVSPEGPFGDFLRLRPFARSGQDFLLIHEANERGLDIRDQAAFDALVRAAGPGRMREHRRRLYEAREHLIGTETEYWIELNPLYPHLADTLPHLAAQEGAYILSTKRSDLVVRILDAQGVRYPAARILDPEGHSKLDVIRRLMLRGGQDRAIFVDDQIDHFAGAASITPGVDCRLAAWGYVLAAWLGGSPDYRVLLPAEARALLAKWVAAT